MGILTIDMPGEKINKLSRSLFDEVAELVDLFEADRDLKGIILISGKEDNFIAGADINDFLAFQSLEDAQAMSRRGQQILARLEALRVPVVAAIHGACLGGGLETALACHYRIASDSPRTVLGQPEVQLGILPGGGGTQRLPRLIGLTNALDLILSGRRVRPRAALRLGLVDDVVPRETLPAAARHAVFGLASDRIRPRRLGVRRFTDLLRAENWRWFLETRNPAGRAIIFRAAAKRTMQKTHGLYPAPIRALDAVRVGISRGPRQGYEIESRYFGELAVSDTCRQLLGIFFAVTSAKNDSGSADSGIPPRKVENLAVVGAGFMGAGIAAISAQAGIYTRLKDQNFDALGKGLKFCHDFFREKHRRRSLTQLEFQQSLDRIGGGIDYSGAGRADLIIEAVFEELTLKQRVLGEVEQHIRPDAIFGSNTSSISIARISESSRRPENVLGLHFFSPVARMPLLEIVVTSRTAPHAIATAVRYASHIDKTPIVVHDGPGFYTSRILAPYVSEALHVLEEGASIESIDRAMIRFGFPVGPLALLDEVGIDVANKVAHVLQEAFGPRMQVAPSSERIARDGRLGRKSGRGFYSYAGKQKKADPGLYDLLPGGSTRKPVAENEIQSRLALAMVNEAVLCLQEGILRSPRDGDLGAVLGLGFPPFRGGPFHYIDSAGAGKILNELIRLAERFPLLFKPAPLLAEMAREGKLFYPRDK